MGEVIGFIIIGIIGFFVGGFIGEYNYSEWFPHCWYGMFAAWGIVVGGAVACHS